ncbi:hypothetical protein JVU11DRAFT_6153 [Chiua virens]|nr:hypothetical protein JVU11DRAFT_6153 [Chiua virens]
MLSLSSESFLVLFVTLALSTLWALKPLCIPRVRTYKRAAQIRSLLDGNPSVGSLLQARAAPNQRLVHAFGVTSTFVSGDTKVHTTFIKQAAALITGIGAGDKKNGWRAVAQNTESAAHHFLPSHHSKVVGFAALIQSITFRVILVALFDTDPEALVYDDVACVTDIINQRWKDSKIKDAAAMAKDDSLQQMMKLIDRWIVDRDRYPNPIDFILPAYETLWRVVAVLVGYVYHYHSNTITLHDTVMEFGRDPTEEQFIKFGDGSRDGNGRMQPCMKAIVLEVLRLHPPTRHIARALVESQSGPWWKTLLMPTTEVADIEALHLSDEYGESPSEFDPMRFDPSRMGGRPAELYSFGYGRLKCVAATWAPKAAAIIAAKVVLQIEEAGCTVTIGRRIGGRSGWDGWVVRKEGKEPAE